MTPAARLRCCGRFCFWRVPYGPWACTTCERTYDGPMPASAEPRFWQAVALEVELAERARRAPVAPASPGWLWRGVLEGLDLEGP